MEAARYCVIRATCSRYRISMHSSPLRIDNSAASNWLLVSRLILYRAVEPARGANRCRVLSDEDEKICFVMRR